MPQRQKSTWLTHEAALAQREWWVVDMAEKTLGRAATRIASVLRGKHKPSFTPNVDSGDFVIVLNAGKLKLTGEKWDDKLYRDHTGYMGHMKVATASQMRERKPEELIRRAVWGMLPKGPLGRRIMKKLKIYSGGSHDHAAQKPRELAL
jgi:large subunit ribosomal protein L13